MQTRIAEGDKFKSPFTGSIFRIKEICRDKVLFEKVGNEHHQLITEVGAVVIFYEKVNERGF